MDGLIDSSLEFRLISGLELVSKFFVRQSVSKIVCVRLEPVLGGDTSSSGFILSCKRL